MQKGKAAITTERCELVSRLFIEEQWSPEEIDRSVLGHWEADTMVGKTGSACLITIVDRYSRYLLAAKVSRRNSILVADKMIELLLPLPAEKLRSITPDRGTEFAKHSYVTNSLGKVQFYFPHPHSP